MRGDERCGWDRARVGRGDGDAGEELRVDARKVRQRRERGERGRDRERRGRWERVRVGFEGEEELCQSSLQELL